MNWTLIGILLAVLSILVTIQLRKKKIRRPKLSNRELYEELKKIMREIKYEPPVLYVFLPNGQLVFGAAWTEKRWIEMLDDSIRQLGDNSLTKATFGERYYLVDLMSGEIISIPVDPGENLTLGQSGARVGQILVMRETK